MYTTTLYLNGNQQKATTLADRILPLLPGKKRYRFRGIGMLDACLHTSMGDNEKAMQALQEWRELGGCIDLSRIIHLHGTLKDEPSYQSMLADIQNELAEQRTNLARMEANGELAEI